MTRRAERVLQSRTQSRRGCSVALLAHPWSHGPRQVGPADAATPSPRDGDRHVLSERRGRWKGTTETCDACGTSWASVSTALTGNAQGGNCEEADAYGEVHRLRRPSRRRIPKFEPLEPIEVARVALGAMGLQSGRSRQHAREPRGRTPIARSFTTARGSRPLGRRPGDGAP
jgi:hypothetical protein